MISGIQPDAHEAASGVTLHYLNEHVREDKMPFHSQTWLRDFFLAAALTSLFLPELSRSSYLNRAEHLWDDVDRVDSGMNVSLWYQHGRKLPKDCLQHLVESELPHK